jgi:hypothetical protein
VPLINPLMYVPTGLRDDTSFAKPSASAGSKRQASDGTTLSWGDANTPGPPQMVAPGASPSVTVAVSPMRSGHAVTVEYRVNGGPIREAMALLEPPAPGVDGRLFRAVLPAFPAGPVEFLPVLRFAGQPISPRLADSTECASYQVGRTGDMGQCSETSTVTRTFSASQPRWDWTTRFIGSCTIMLRREVVGTLSDGVRINWHFVEGHFDGPELHGDFLPGGTDWMRIRPDGVGLVEVKGSLQTPKGARVYVSYSGIVDLGPDGYARALRGEAIASPSFVGTPTYATGDPELAWLNRAQCVCVGRVDMKVLRVEYDVYAIAVGERK